MTLSRCLVSMTLAALSGVTALAQLSAPAPAEDNLSFANGIVAVAEDKIITVADVMTIIGPLIPQLQREVRNPREFQEQLEILQDNTIQDLIDKVLIVKEFRKDDKRQIPVSYIDNVVSDEIADRFEGDRSKFLAYLRSRGMTIREYRNEVEENIIFQFMQGQQHKSQSVVSPVRIETYYRENKDRFYQEDAVHLRLIQLSRAGESDESLTQKANFILTRFRSGVPFADLAREYSTDVRRARGGDWEWLTRSGFRQEFVDVAFNLKPGEASEPILLPEGAFVLYIEDRKYAGIQPIDEVRDQIEQILVQQMGRSSHERWLERLRRNGYVKYY